MLNHRSIHSFSLSLALLLCALGTAIGQESFNVTINKNPIRNGETLQLSLSLKNLRVDASAPQIKGLKLLGGPSTSQNNSWVNGVSSSEIRYTYTYQVQSSQDINVPSYTVNGSNKILKSNAFKIKVLPRSTKQQKKIAEIYNAIVSACDMIITSQKANQTRTKKPVAKDKIVARLKYQKEDTTLKIASVNPIDILESAELWVYNVKTRKLGKYVAEEHATLQVKGTTILYFDEKQSVQKTLRKPLEQLASFNKGNKVFVRKFMDSIKTTETKLNGRINDQTILLKVTK